MTQIEEIKKIRLIMIKTRLEETCEGCNFTYVPMYRSEGYALCPHCDSGVIEAYKRKVE